MTDNPCFRWVRREQLVGGLVQEDGGRKTLSMQPETGYTQALDKDARRAAPHGRTPLPRSLSASTARTTIRCYSSSAPLSLKKKRLGGDGNRGLREGIWMAGRTPKVWMTSYSSSGGDPVVEGARAGGASLHNPRRPQLGAGQSAWPDLPPELLESILLRLVPIDRVAVRLVCSAWRSCARASISADLPFEAPRLLLRRPGSCGSLAFFSLRRLEILPFALPDRLNAGRCCGQIGGWLAMAFDEERAIELRNLFSGESVAMPRPPAFPVAKIVLSAPPTSLGWVAAVLDSSGTLALLQPDVSGGAWITIAAGEKHGGFRDVAFWRRRLCALGLDGTVLAYRADLRARVAAVSELREKDSQRQRQVYLVESEGELLLVSKLYRVMGVKVCRFRPEESKWEEVTELPGKAVFVGTVASVAVLATAALPGIRANCVYFAQRNVDTILPHAIGVCPLGDQETAVVAIAGGHSVDVEPVWIIPSVA